jgi:hypothetical protein
MTMTITTRDEAAVLYDCCLRVIALAGMYSDEAVTQVIERIASQVRVARDTDEGIALTFIMEAVKLASKE